MIIQAGARVLPGRGLALWFPLLIFLTLAFPAALLFIPLLIFLTFAAFCRVFPAPGGRPVFRPCRRPASRGPPF